LNAENTASEETLYYEWVPMSKFVKVIIASIILFTLTFTIPVAVASLEHLLPYTVIISLTTVFLLLILWNFRGLKITVTKNYLKVEYGVFNKKTFPISDIVGCEPTRANFGKYFGIGVRFGIDGSWAYTTSFGSAVKVVPTEGRVFVFSSRNPEKICALINKMKGYS